MLERFILMRAVFEAGNIADVGSSLVRFQESVMDPDRRNPAPAIRSDVAENASAVLMAVLVTWKHKRGRPSIPSVTRAKALDLARGSASCYDGTVDTVAP